MGVIGILLVYIFTDNEATKKAVIGCAVAMGSTIVFYLVYVAVVLAAISSDPYYF